MEKDFSQPFQVLPTTEVSIIVRLDNGYFALTKLSGSLDEYTLPRVELRNSEDTVIQIAEFLHNHGLLLAKLRQLLHDRDIQFSFIDDTPGSVKHSKVFLAEVESMHGSADLILLPYEGLHKRLSESSFTDDIELSALRYLQCK